MLVVRLVALALEDQRDHKVHREKLDSRVNEARLAVPDPLDNVVKQDFLVKLVTPAVQDLRGLLARRVHVVSRAQLAHQDKAVRILSQSLYAYTYMELYVHVQLQRPMVVHKSDSKSFSQLCCIAKASFPNIPRISWTSWSGWTSGTLGSRRTSRRAG